MFWLEILLDGLGVYACIWILGLYATMVQREHCVDSQFAIFHRGILGRATLRPIDIANVIVLPPQKGFRARTKTTGAYLGVGGVGAVLVEPL